jgi:hypothetical protein
LDSAHAHKDDNQHKTEDETLTVAERERVTQIRHNVGDIQADYYLQGLLDGKQFLTTTPAIFTGQLLLPPCRSCGADAEEFHEREWSFSCMCWSTGFYKDRDAALHAWCKRQGRPTTTDRFVHTQLKKPTKRD